MDGLDGEREGLHTLAMEIGDELLLALAVPSQKLYGTVAMRTHSLAAIDPLLQFRVTEHLVELRSPQGGRHGCHQAVEEFLHLGHHLSQLLHLALGHIMAGTLDERMVALAQSLM